MAKPNVLLIMVDDMGYSDLGCYGGEIDSPNIDNLANNGIFFSSFYNTPKCSPSRASLLTGLYPCEVGMGFLASSGMELVPEPPDGYAGNLSKDCVTIAEVLKQHGYGTYISGKWHLSNDLENEDETWPRSRGFDHHYGNINGATSYFYPATVFRDGIKVDDEALNDPDFYYTDKISENACNFIDAHIKDSILKENNDKEKPFFMYLAYTAPHWPLHAKPEDIAKYKGRFDEGWDELRKNRLEKMKKIGLIKQDLDLSDPGLSMVPWDDLDDEEKEWELRRMETYAAMIDCVDKGVGKVVNLLKKHDIFDNTLIIFLSDNGASAEEIGDSSKSWIEKGVTRAACRDGTPIKYGCNDSILPGPENTWQSYGRIWATLSDTPFRGYKDDTYEGGISTPLIIHLPKDFKYKGGVRHQVAQLNDIFPTILEITGAKYPEVFNGNKIKPLEGKSLVSCFDENSEFKKDDLYWEHRDSKAIREGDWKLVTFRFTNNWELFNINEDRIESKNQAKNNKDLVENLEKKWNQWADRCNVLPYNDVMKIKNKYAKKKLEE